MSREIRFVDRSTGKTETEIVYGEGALRWLYTTSAGRLLERGLLSRRFISVLYGRYLASGLSRGKIADFVTRLGIDPEESERPPEDYACFNDYFTRRLKPERRPIDPDPEAFVSSADGRLLAFPCHKGLVLPVKGRKFTLEKFLRSAELARRFAGGWCIIVRLCPADYHRYHFPVAGVPGRSRPIRGRYRSVSPVVIEQDLAVFDENQRQVSLHQSEAFGSIALVEVGAICVGAIVQTYTPGAPVLKGQEKGYFEFGGSTQVLLVEKDRVDVDADLCENSASGVETRVLMGERIARRRAI